MTLSETLIPLWQNANVCESYQASLFSTVETLDFSSPFESVPSIFCEMLGGDYMIGEQVTIAWNLLRLAGRILDNFEDKDLLMSDKDAPIILNNSTGLLITSSQIITSLCLDPRTTLNIQSQVNKYLLELSSGQHNDLSMEYPTLAKAIAVAEAKTGKLAELGCWLGVRVATDADKYLVAAKQYGVASGIMAQLRDDLSDLERHNNNKSDIENRRFGSVPIAFAIDNLPKKDAKAIMSGSITAEETYHLIIKSGAPIYIALQLRLYYGRALNALSAFSTADPSEKYLNQLKSLIDSMVLTTHDI